MDAAGNFLSANRTQDSFLYSANTPKSPSRPAGASDGTALKDAIENRFQRLIDNPVRRSQLERLVGQDEDMNFEGTQVDPYLEATQVESPIAYASTQV